MIKLIKTVIGTYKERLTFFYDKNVFRAPKKQRAPNKVKRPPQHSQPRDVIVIDSDDDDIPKKVFYTKIFVY